MRKVYVKIEDFKNFTSRLDKVEGTNVLILKNRRSQSLILSKASVHRSIVAGVYFLDNWGDVNKWFCDRDTSMQPLW